MNKAVLDRLRLPGLIFIYNHEKPVTDTFIEIRFDREPLLEAEASIDTDPKF